MSGHYGLDLWPLALEDPGKCWGRGREGGGGGGGVKYSAPPLAPGIYVKKSQDYAFKKLGGGGGGRVTEAHYFVEWVI